MSYSTCIDRLWGCFSLELESVVEMLRGVGPGDLAERGCLGLLGESSTD